jgi:multidrug efflux system membrane fusion protein
VRAQTDGIWVSGLPDEARIISIGQGFVNDGETVDPQPDEDRSMSAAPSSGPGADAPAEFAAGTASREVIQ